MQPESVETGQNGLFSRIARVVLGLAIVGIVAMWIYAFFFASKEAPDKLEDETFGPRAEAVCVRYREAVDALPPARDTPQIADRAAVLDEANEIVADWIADLRTVDVSGTKDTDLVGRWLDDWDQYLENRRNHQASLEAGVDRVFTEAAVNGSPITLRMNQFAKLNDMPTCQTPGDV